MARFDYPIQVPVMVTSEEQLAQIYAVLAGTALSTPLAAAPYQPNTGDRPETVASKGNENAKPVTSLASVGDATQVLENPASAGTGPTATTDASPSDDANEIDAHGWPWSPELHASTKGQTKDGLWRMKVGVTRPDPKPGFPKTIETPSETSTISQASAAVSGATEPAGSTPTEAPVSAAASQDDDEFAAFHAAVAKADAEDGAAKASVPPRTYSDADLGALCNQAAVKMNDPAPVKAIIAQFVPEGEVAHSRNVPQDKRAEFVAAVEAKAGIEFAG